MCYKRTSLALYTENTFVSFIGLGPGVWKKAFAVFSLVGKIDPNMIDGRRRG